MGATISGLLYFIVGAFAVFGFLRFIFDMQDRMRQYREDRRREHHEMLDRWGCTSRTRPMPRLKEYETCSVRALLYTFTGSDVMPLLGKER